jgi:hypothetical protein
MKVYFYASPCMEHRWQVSFLVELSELICMRVVISEKYGELYSMLSLVK